MGKKPASEKTSVLRLVCTRRDRYYGFRWDEGTTPGEFLQKIVDFLLVLEANNSDDDDVCVSLRDLEVLGPDSDDAPGLRIYGKDESGAEYSVNIYPDSSSKHQDRDTLVYDSMLKTFSVYGGRRFGEHFNIQA